MSLNNDCPGENEEASFVELRIKITSNGIQIILEWSPNLLKPIKNFFVRLLRSSVL